MTESKELTDLVEFTVACARQGRTIASIGAYLTGAEQERIPEIYSRLETGEDVREKSPTIAIVTSRKGRAGKIPIGEAVKWFIDNYPKQSLHLQQKMQERKKGKTKTILAYGLKEARELLDEYYMKIIGDITSLPKEQVALLYYGVLKPQAQKLDELKGLTETEIK